MKYCRNCNLKIDNDVERCLFCDSKLEELDNNYSSSFSLKKPKGYYADKLKRILIFSFISLFLISCLFRTYLFKDRPYHIFVLITSIFVYFVISKAIEYSKGTVAKISTISMLTSLYCTYLFYFFDLNVIGIYFTYVFPGVTVSGLIAMLIIFLITKGKNIHDEFIYIFVSSLFGMIPFIFVLFNIIEVTFIASITSLFSFLVLMSFIFFVYKDSKEELKRRFHI